MQTPPGSFAMREVFQVRPLIALGLAVGMTGLAGAAEPAFHVPGARLKERVHAVLALMGFEVIPDVTTTSLSVRNTQSGDPDVTLSQLGAGFTWGDDFPLYLEGMLSYSRYDPTFVATNGRETRSIPVKWDSAAATIGIGWDFTLADGLVFRPIINGTVGYVTSDVNLAIFYLNEEFDRDLAFLRNRDLTAVGYGGSAVLDYELYRPTYEIDVELRYSYMRLETVDAPFAVEGTADVSTLNLWTRWRAPISDWTAFEHPVRYVLEMTHSEFLGDQRDLLGFERLTSLGLGLELQPDWLIDRARVMGRYVFGENVEGFSVGFAVTF